MKKHATSLTVALAFMVMAAGVQSIAQGQSARAAAQAHLAAAKKAAGYEVAEF